MVDAAGEFAAVVADYRARNEALERRVRFLEWRLEQRAEVSRRDFESLKPYFEGIKVKILSIFMDLPVTSGLSTNELEGEFRSRFPGVSTVHLYRRARELCSEGKLWSCPDAAGSVRFYLRLKDVELRAEV